MDAGKRASGNDIDMANKEDWIKRRLEEIQEKSRYSGKYVYSDFLSPLEASYAHNISKPNNLKVWGGYESAERVVARFGNEDEIGYEENYPVVIIKISCLNEKYTQALTHRDYLGALIHLGIERSVLGDIIIDKNRQEAYVFVLERMSEFVIENLYKVKHTNVMAEIIEEFPKNAAPTLTNKSIIVQTPRLDGIISKVFSLSRSEAKNKFSKQEVFKNGIVCDNPSVQLSENDTISVRHKGKFIYRGIQKKTKKGRDSITVSLYE